MNTRKGKGKAPRALPHQTEGTEFLRTRERAALFDEQGLGKTKQLIDAIAAQTADGTLAGALVICPNGLKTTWAEELERHSTLPYAVFGAGRKARRVAFGSLKAAFYVINYEAVAAELPSLRALLRFKRMALVLDESHRIKSPSARVTGAVLQLRSDAAKRYAMTGTPVANKPEDLWSQLFFLDDGAALGQSFDAFRARYCTGGGYTRIEEIREHVEHLALRREKHTALTLPEKRLVRVPVDLRGKQLRLYNEMRNKLEIWVRNMTGAQVRKQGEAILARLVRLAQLASNPGLLDTAYGEDPAKFVALDQLLGTLMRAPEQKVIVWTSFVDNVRPLKRRYQHLNPVAIHGEVTGSQRDAAVVAFRSDPAVRLLIANPAAAREGLTLTVANVAVYLDRTFNLVDFLQSQDRIHRISQTRACEIVLLTATNTIDDFIDFSLAQKHRLARFAQRDSDGIAADDLALRKPTLLRALLAPANGSVRARRGTRP